MEIPYNELNTPCNCEGRGFYTRAQIDEMLSGIVDQDTVEAILDQMFDDYISQGDLEQYIINAMANTYTQDEIDALLADMATRTWVQSHGYLTEHQSLDGYATEQWVGEQGFLTQHQDITNKLDVTAFTEYTTLLEAWGSDVNAYIADLTEKTRQQARYIERLYAAVFPSPTYTGVTLVVTYNVTSTTVPTRILASTDSITSATYGGNPITIAQDYTFDQTGDRQITFEFYLDQNPVKTPEATFAGVTALKSAEFQSGGIINSNFFKDSGLQTITLPSGLSNIYDSAFKGTSIQTITIPNSVIDIWTSAFEDCANLSAVTFQAGGTNELRILCDAFYGCTNLATITFPARLSKLYCDTFSEDMTSITFEGTNPPELWNRNNALGPDSFNFPIYVPASAVNAYRQHIDWENYQGRVTSA